MRKDPSYGTLSYKKGLDVYSFITPVHRNLVALKNKKHRRGHACGPCNNILVDGTAQTDESKRSQPHLAGKRQEKRHQKQTRRYSKLIHAQPCARCAICVCGCLTRARRTPLFLIRETLPSRGLSAGLSESTKTCFPWCLRAHKHARCRMPKPANTKRSQQRWVLARKAFTSTVALPP